MSQNNANPIDAAISGLRAAFGSSFFIEKRTDGSIDVFTVGDDGEERVTNLGDPVELLRQIDQGRSVNSFLTPR